MSVLSHRAKLPGIVLASALLVACGPNVRYSRTQDPPRPLMPKAANEVEVFTEEMPGRTFVQVGLLTARQTEDQQMVISMMQERAAKVGCDGIVVAQPKGRGSIRAACIVFTEAAEEEPKVAAKPEPEEPKEEAPPPEPEPQPPPDGAAGFKFAQSVDEASKICKDAKFRWRQQAAARYSCSGAPVPIGVPATTRLRFCEGRLCEINVDAERADPAATWSDEFKQTRDALAQKYGDAKKTSDTLPADCGEAELAKCVKDGRAGLVAEWWWASGEKIVERLGNGEKANSVVVTLTYTKWPLDPPAGAEAAPASDAPAEPPSQ